MPPVAVAILVGVEVPEKGRSEVGKEEERKRGSELRREEEREGGEGGS